MDARTIATILRTAEMPDRSDMVRMAQGITGARRTILRTDSGSVECIVKRSVCGMLAESEALAYTVSTLSPGLVDCPVTILRQDAEGYTVSVQAFVSGTVPFRSFASTLRSDIVGMAAYDHIIANGDRHSGNALVLATGHHHHDRLVAIDHGAAFTNHAVDFRLCTGKMQGLRVPAYIHDHAERIANGSDTLRAACGSFGLPESVARATVDAASIMARAESFPRW